MDFRGGFFDPAAAAWVVDTTRTNRFIYNDTIHALYATYGRPVGKLGFLAGLRMEQTRVNTNQVTARLTDQNDYFRIYPTLHLSYNLTETGQLQLNYSHRIHHPESDDLNPFPEYQDPYNLRAGNPHLRPEDTHSIETGYQYRKAKRPISRPSTTATPITASPRSPAISTARRCSPPTRIFRRIARAGWNSPRPPISGPRRSTSARTSTATKSTRAISAIPRENPRRRGTPS